MEMAVAIVKALDGLVSFEESIYSLVEVDLGQLSRESDVRKPCCREV